MSLIKLALQRLAPTFWAYMTGNGAHPRLPQPKQSRFETWQDSLNELAKIT